MTVLFTLVQSLVQTVLVMLQSSDGWNKIEHLGGVEIGKNVEIGAKSAIDRGALGILL